MDQQTLGGDDINGLRATYRRRVERDLPRVADHCGDWPITADHCFARVVLDAVFDGVWYDHVDGRPAYEHLSPEELRTAISVAERLLEEGRPAVVELNDQSLRWRRDRE